METMTHTKSAAKNLRRAKKKTALNRKIQEEVKNLKRKLLKTRNKRDFIALQKALDKAKKTGAIPKNKADRIKRRAWAKI